MLTSKIALKEWAIVLHALSLGQQLFILRKGGIRDPEGTFRLESREFLLYPTFEHQRESAIRPEFKEQFRLLLNPTAEPTENVSFKLYAGVAFCGEVRSPAQLKGLEKYHLWTPEFLAERMEGSAFLLLLRTYTLPQTISHPVKPEDLGCKSWVSLTEEIPVQGAAPVVDNQRFRRILEEVTVRLDPLPTKRFQAKGIIDA